MNRYVCIHGHFYQPPRENPWLEEVEVQDSAHPYRDWNARITAECYSPNGAARIKSGEGKIIDIVNNYSKISFNFGPTLLSWMEVHAPDAYKQILEADALSRELYSGHGSAIAQVYNHMIMPLSNKRDKQTQVIWGIEDFRYRFGREPEGMWLAETAVDIETLEVLAEYGIKYTILAPRQAGQIKKIEDSEWTDVSDASIDPKRAYLCNLPSGKSISLFFYDGPISQELAFGDLLKNGENLANRMAGTFTEGDDPQIAHIATDGETYGHHQKHGDMALAYCINYLQDNQMAQVTVYGEFLEKFPPQYEVRIIENTSWSCAHGVERWRGNCGCNSGREGWIQEWRQPLREALDYLRDSLTPLYEEELKDFVNDPWKLRDEYIKVILDRSPENVDKFFSTFEKKELTSKYKVRILKMLEMQRHAMLMYTSCGWFFDEISGIETVQVIMYAGRAIQLAKDLTGEDFESEFVKRLEKAPSNIPEVENGAHAYESYVKPAMVDFLRVAAHYAISSLFSERSENPKIYSYEHEEQEYKKLEAGKYKMAVGRVLMHSRITTEECLVTYAVLHLGDHNVNGGVRESISNEAYNQMRREMEDAFKSLNVADMILLMDKHFGTHNFTLWHLFKDESRKVFNIIMMSTQDEIEFYFRQIYENHYPVMQAIISARLPLPNAIMTAVEYVINTDVRRILESDDPIDQDKLKHLTNEAKKWSIITDKDTLSFAASRRINKMMELVDADPLNNELLQSVADSMKSLNRLHLELNLWKAQNILFLMSREYYKSQSGKARRGNAEAKKWLENYETLKKQMNVDIT